VKRIAFGVCMAVLSASSLASAQFLYPNPAWCPTCYIEGNVDTPVEASYERANLVTQGQWYIAGWAFVCFNGQLPNRYEVLYRTNDGSIRTLTDTIVIDNLPRPDVQAWFAAYRPSCAAPANAGYHIYMPTPIPSGTREVYINVWHGALLHGRYRVVTIR
jgi:hypothetical protein